MASPFYSHMQSTNDNPAPIALPWSDIDRVLLDMDGTVLDLGFDNFFWKEHVPKRYAEANGLSFDAAWEHIFPQMQAVRGTLDWYSVHYWSDWLDLDVPALKREVANRIGPRPGAMDFLQRLRGAGKRVVLATNAHQDTLEIKFTASTLGQWLDAVYTSHELGAVKESRSFWEALQSAEEFDCGRTLFIDDHPGVLRAAREFGIAHVYGIRVPDNHGPPLKDNGFEQLLNFDQISGGL